MTNITKETWQNVTKGLVEISESDSAGRPKGRTIRAGGKVVISTADRLMNQDYAASPEKDLFRNGVLAPVRLAEDAEDYVEIASNPNFLSESDISELLKAPIGQVRDRLGQIDSKQTLEVIRTMADDLDDVRKTVTSAIADRINVVNPPKVAPSDKAPNTPKAPQAYSPN